MSYYNNGRTKEIEESFNASNVKRKSKQEKRKKVLIEGYTALKNEKKCNQVKTGTDHKIYHLYDCINKGANYNNQENKKGGTKRLAKKYSKKLKKTKKYKTYKRKIKTEKIKKTKRKSKGGSIIFKDGIKIKTEETYEGKPFFRKVFYYSDPPRENQIIAAQNEYEIVKLLINNPFPNIVTFYSINKDYVEMEELHIDYNLYKLPKLEKEKLIDTMRKVKDFLQSLGIIYIDWKTDNIGIDKDGIYKLFDFDVSGLINLKTNQWIVKPLEYWSYNKAIENGYKTPQEIDDFSFEYGLVGIKDKSF
jgi:serine/threonine protein kinase